MSQSTRTSAELAEMFPPVPASPQTAPPVGVVPAAEATLGMVFAILRRELFGKRYRRTLDAAALQH